MLFLGEKARALRFLHYADVAVETVDDETDQSNLLENNSEKCQFSSLSNLEYF